MSNEQDRRTIFRLQDELRLANEANAALQAEVERLRKAGDGLLEIIDEDEIKARREFLGEHGFDPVSAWLAAKGVQP